MDDKRKRYLTAGVLVGAIVVGLIVLLRRTPRDQWGPTIVKIAREGLKLARSRYGSTEIIAASESILSRLEEAVEDRSTSAATA